MKSRWLLLALCCAFAACADDPGAPLEIATVPLANVKQPAEITVTSTVIQKNVEPIGANLGRIAGGTMFAINNHVNGSGFEPAVIRLLLRIDRAGVDSKGQWMEWDTNGGVHFYETNATGFGDGARVDAYRLVDKSNKPLAFSAGLHDAAGADHLIKLGQAKVPTGGWIAQGKSGQNRVYIDNKLNLRLGDYALVKIKHNHVPKSLLHNRIHQYYRGHQPYLTPRASGTTGKLVPHPKPLPAALGEPGETCLQLTATEAKVQQVGQVIYHPYDDKEGQWYSQLNPGASYRAEAWLRQEGLGGGGKVRFRFYMNSAYDSINQTTPWTVTGTWKRYTYDFVAPAYPTTGKHIAQGLEFTGPGKLYVDNFLVYRNDAKHKNKPFTPHEISLDEMMASAPASGPKPAIRFYNLSYHNSTVQALLSNHGNASYSVNTGGLNPFRGATIPQNMQWALSTGATPADRVVPYLTLTEEFTEDDWKAVVEYLGVPYDATKDTPQSKPHAYRRYKHRGDIGTPWTAEFREIILEYGNETWHNGAGGYGWHGFGRPGWVHKGGVEYGLFARFMFKENIAKQPAWKQHNLGARIKFALGGNYSATKTSYGEAAVQKAGPIISYLGHANYVGPKWETGDTGSTSFNDHGMQETLVGMVTRVQKVVTDAAAMQKQLNSSAGLSYRVIAYEGGPSGYWQNKNNPTVDEQYGKSLGMGVAALDAWLFSSQHGYGHQCYLGFSSGRWWSSHTLPEAGGFRAHPGWLALAMRNRHAPGREMLEVKIHKAPSYQRKGTSIPLIAAYAIKDRDLHTSVFVLSRKLDGKHDGHDFGDGYTPVTLKLPFSKNPLEIKLYKLAKPGGAAADPRANNLKDRQIALVEQTIPLSAYSSSFVISDKTGGGKGGMPPGTIYLYRFKHKQAPQPDAGSTGADGAGAADGAGGGDAALAEPAEQGCSCSLTAGAASDSLPLLLAALLIGRRRKRTGTS